MAVQIRKDTASVNGWAVCWSRTNVEIFIMVMHMMKLGWKQVEGQDKGIIAKYHTVNL